MAGGSFASLSKMRDTAQGERDDRLAAEAEERRKLEEAESEKEATKDGVKPDPAVHYSETHGELTEKELFEKYSDVVTQITEKSYMLSGFASHKLVAGKTEITIRTLRKNEQRVVSLLAEGEMDKDGNAIYHPDDLMRWSIVFALSKVGQQNMEPVTMPVVHGSTKRFVTDTNTQLKELVNSDQVKKRLAIVDEWPVPVFNAARSVYVDIDAAYRMAILKDMRNPS